MLLKVHKAKQLHMEGGLLPSQPCGSCRGQLGREEGIRDVLGKLHQLVGISDVCQAKPEDGPLAIGEAAVTLFEVPEETLSQNKELRVLFLGCFLFCSTHSQRN